LLVPDSDPYEMHGSCISC